MSYWLWRDGPTPQSDNRRAAALGATTITPLQFQAILALPEEWSRAALRRCLELAM